MQLFYYDENMKIYEEQREYSSLITYLEKLPFSEQIFSTILAYSWYLYNEGDFIDSKTAENWKFYQAKWIEMLELAKHYQQYPIICLISGYTLEMNGMDINNSLEYENQIKDLYRKSKINLHNKEISDFVDYITSNEKSKLDTMELKKLFPNNSLIDKYFVDILSVAV